MNKKHLAATICIQIICLCAIAWTLTRNSVAPVEAHVLYQASTATPTPTPVPPFLGPIYYDEEYIWKIFDHQLPGDYAPLPLFPGVRHYDNTLHNPPTSEYGYDGHIGIDYSLIYEPVLASAGGVVEVAGWSNAANHRLGYGLRVVMSYAANADYTTIYGHLSTLNVETGDEIEIDPTDPGNRNRIIGISGNTGHVFNNDGDCAPIPDSGPNCGQHLHFETRRNGVYVNPYGWIGSVPDPWALHDDGTVSHYLWANQPAVLSTQYIDSGPQGTPVDEPPLNEARLIIDNASHDFTVENSTCWIWGLGDGSFNGDYRRAQTTDGGVGKCASVSARWTIHPDAFSPAGDYDVFAHIPDRADAALSAFYTIQHNGQTDQAIIVQAAYGSNPEHDAWAYLGRYEFAMSNSIGEYVELTNETLLEDDIGHWVTADAIKLLPADPTPPPVDVIYVSFANDGVVGNVAYADEDILAYDTNSGQWFLFFDGSDLGFAANGLDAFLFSEGNIFFSLNEPHMYLYDDSDVLQFAPTSLGEQTAGTITRYLRGATVGLTDPAEDIDALALAVDGRLLLSTIGQATVKGGPFADEDLFAYNGNQEFSLYLDGTVVQADDIVAASLDADDEEHPLYLALEYAFAGGGTDILRYTPTQEVATLFWNGSAHGLGASAINGLVVGNWEWPCGTAGIFRNGGFESALSCWYVDHYGSDIGNWELYTDDAHTGQNSANGRLTLTEASGAMLYSEPFDMMPNTRYRFSFYGKTIESNLAGTFTGLIAYWNGSTSAGGTIILSTAISAMPGVWTWYSTDYVCPPPEADSARFNFYVNLADLDPSDDLTSPESQVDSVLIDDVRIESQTGMCPLLNP